MRIVYFGTYSAGPGYPRNRVIIEGLRRRDIEVVECHAALSSAGPERALAVRKPLRLLRFGFGVALAWCRLAVKFFGLPRYDAMVVGYFGQIDVFLARVLSVFRRGRPIVLDAFLSPYDTAVNDRRLLKPGSLAARALHGLEAWAYRCADFVVADTPESAAFLCAEFGLSRSKVSDVPVGSIASLEPTGSSVPTEAPTSRQCRVLFFGTYVPLQGVPTIVDAAHRLVSEDQITFRLLGRGQCFDAVRGRVQELGLTNLTLVDRFIPYSELVGEIAAADICLGVFGRGAKAERVVPCKVFDCLCLGKPLITADTPAARRAIENGRTGVLVPPGDPDALARAILELSRAAEVRRRLGEAAAAVFRRRFAPEHVVAKLCDYLSAHVRPV